MIDNKGRAAGNCCPFLFMVMEHRMKSIIVLAALLISCQWAKGQEVGLTLTLTNVLPGSRPSGTITLGAHPNATNGLDAVLGEREIPSLPPPAGVFIIYTVPPTSDVLWLSPKDLRKLPADAPVMHEYNLNMTWTGGELEISTKQRLPVGIDSAYVVDVITDFPNNFIKARIDSGMVFATDNPALTRFKVLVWYKAATTSVDEDKSSTLTLAPNPSSDVLSIAGFESGSRIDVLTLTGELLTSVRTESTSMLLPVHTFPIGAYVVRVIDQRGRVMQRIMMHQ
jgi:hypothetical protein